MRNGDARDDGDIYALMMLRDCGLTDGDKLYALVVSIISETGVHGV